MLSSFAFFRLIIFCVLPCIALASLCFLCILVPQKWQQKNARLIKDAIKPGISITTVDGTTGTILTISQHLIRILCPDGSLKQVTPHTIIRIDDEKK